MTFAEMASVAAEAVVEDVAARLLSQGAAVELRQLSGLSAQEFDVLVDRERTLRWLI